MRGYVASLGQYIEPENSNRRDFGRREFRTAGTAYIPADGPQAPGWAARVWTRDVSVSGAKLSSNEEISTERFYLKLLLPQLSEQVLECEIMHRTDASRARINGKEHREYVYGICFRGVLTNDELSPTLLALLAVSPTAGKPADA